MQGEFPVHIILAFLFTIIRVQMDYKYITNFKKLSSLLQPEQSHKTGPFTYLSNKPQSPSKHFQPRFHQMLISHGSHAFIEKIILKCSPSSSSKHYSFQLHSTCIWSLLTLSFVKQPALSFLCCCLACFLSFYK